MSYSRYVAIGDSTVEGMDDPDGSGGYRGWADRLASRLARDQGSILYANLGVRGRTTRQVLDEQLTPALAMKPDLAAVVSGTNDLLRRQFDAATLRRDIETMQQALIRQGATVITFTLPDLSAVMPLARMLRKRLHAMNDAIREASATTGTIVCDFAAYPVASDARLWSGDRLHANSLGHALMADALAWHLGLPGTNRDWANPLERVKPPTPLALLRAEQVWLRTHLLPWLWRHTRGQSSGDGVHAKRPDLAPFE
jgi:lysophospholipase L1-like esterase